MPVDPVTAVVAVVPVPLDALLELDGLPDSEMDETPPSAASVKSLSTVCEMVPVDAVDVR